jgi:serine/threonine protein kinase
MSQATSSRGAAPGSAEPLPADAPETGRKGLAVELTGGTVNGRYRLTATPSQWAVGTAHPAVDLLDHELVVLVYPTIPPGRDMDFYRRAAAEVERTRGLRGTSLVCMRDCGALANGRPYFVMQRVQAHSVQKYVAERGPIPVDTAVHLLDQILLLAGRAHGFGVVLGDIRPANIFVTESRGSDARTFLAPTVVDTGYARGLFDGLIALPEPPPAYRSPQRRRGESASIADDIYALGALLSFLVTGRAPRISTGESLDAAAWGPSRIRPDLRITPLLDRIVLRCLDPRPEARWPSVEDMRASLEALRQLLTLPRSARALLDDLLTQPPALSETPSGLGGLARGPRIAADVPTVEITPEPRPDEAGGAGRPRADTMPFDPRELGGTIPPKPEAPPESVRTPKGLSPAPAPGGEASGTRPLSSDQLRRLLRVIDSAVPDAPADAVPPGSQPLDPPRFSLLKGQAPTVTPAVRPVTGSHEVHTPSFSPAPPHWLTDAATQPGADAAPAPATPDEPSARPVPELAVLVREGRANEPPGEAATLPRPRSGPLPAVPGPGMTEAGTRPASGPLPQISPTGPQRAVDGEVPRTRTAPLVRLEMAPSEGTAEASAQGRLRTTGPQLRFGDAPVTEPAGRVTGTLPATPGPGARGPLGRGPGAQFGEVEPLDLPADVHAIPPADGAESGDERGLHALHRWRLGLAAGGGLACAAALAFFAFQRAEPGTPTHAAAGRPAVSAGYLPSAAVPETVRPPVSVAPPVAPATAPAPASAEPEPAVAPPSPVAAAAPPASAAAPAPLPAATPRTPAAATVSARGTSPARGDREDAPIEAVRVEDPFGGATGEPPPGKIAVRIRTAPVAARVVRFKSGEVMCATTPCSIVYAKLKAGTRMRLRLEAEGYAPQDAYIKVDESSDVEFRLDGPKRSPPAAPSASVGATPAPPVPAPPPASTSPDPAATPGAMPF